MWARSDDKNDGKKQAAEMGAETSDIYRNLGDAAQARSGHRQLWGGATKAQTAWYRMKNLRDTLNTNIETAAFDR